MPTVQSLNQSSKSALGLKVNFYEQAQIKTNENHMSKLTRNQNSNIAEINHQISEIHDNESGFLNKNVKFYENQNKQELNSQKKQMRILKCNLQNVINIQAQQGNFEAFNIQDETIDRRIVKVKFNENDNMIKLGRIAIKNRVKPFTLEITKHNMTL